MRRLRLRDLPRRVAAFSLLCFVASRLSHGGHRLKNGLPYDKIVHAGWRCDFKSSSGLASASCDIGSVNVPVLSVYSSIRDTVEERDFIDEFIRDVSDQKVDEPWEIVIGVMGASQFRYLLELVPATFQQFYTLRLRLVLLSSDPGLYETWDYLVAEFCSGKLLSNWNVDDKKLPNSLQYRISLLAQHEDIDVVSSPVFVSRESGVNWRSIQRGLQLPCMYCGIHGNYYSLSSFVRSDLQSGELSEEAVHNYPHNAPVYRRSLHTKFGGFSSASQETPALTCSDWRFWTTVARGGGKFYHVEDPLEIYFVRESSHAHRQDTGGNECIKSGVNALRNLGLYNNLDATGYSVEEQARHSTNVLVVSQEWPGGFSASSLRLGEAITWLSQNNHDVHFTKVGEIGDLLPCHVHFLSKLNIKYVDLVSRFYKASDETFHDPLATHFDILLLVGSCLDCSLVNHFFSVDPKFYDKLVILDPDASCHASFNVRGCSNLMLSHAENLLFPHYKNSSLFTSFQNKSIVLPESVTALRELIKRPAEAAPKTANQLAYIVTPGKEHLVKHVLRAVFPYVSLETSHGTELSLFASCEKLLEDWNSIETYLSRHGVSSSFGNADAQNLFRKDMHVAVHCESCDILSQVRSVDLVIAPHRAEESPLLDANLYVAFALDKPLVGSASVVPPQMCMRNRVTCIDDSTWNIVFEPQQLTSAVVNSLLYESDLKESSRERDSLVPSDLSRKHWALGSIVEVFAA